VGDVDKRASGQSSQRLGGSKLLATGGCLLVSEVNQGYPAPVDFTEEIPGLDILEEFLRVFDESFRDLRVSAFLRQSDEQREASLQLPAFRQSCIGQLRVETQENDEFLIGLIARIVLVGIRKQPQGFDA
jgi:hypothetical protein